MLILILLVALSINYAFETVRDAVVEYYIPYFFDFEMRSSYFGTRNNSSYKTGQEKPLLRRILNEGEWQAGRIDCCYDVSFLCSGGQHVFYCPKNGIFYDYTNDKSQTISEEDRVTLNAYLRYDQAPPIDIKRAY